MILDAKIQFLYDTKQWIMTYLVVIYLLVYNIYLLCMPKEREMPNFEHNQMTLFCNITVIL